MSRSLDEAIQELRSEIRKESARVATLREKADLALELQKALDGAGREILRWALLEITRALRNGGPTVEDSESLLHAAERCLIEEAMERKMGVQKRASEELGISDRVINDKLRKLGIMRPIADRGHEGHG